MRWFKRSAREYHYAKLEGSKQAEVSSRSSSRIFRRDSFLKQVKDSDEKKKEAKEKGDGAQLHRVSPGLLEPGYRLLTTELDVKGKTNSRRKPRL